jgi:hypothetical protein
MAYQYAFDAAQLLDECLDHLQEVIDAEELTRKRYHHSCLYDMKEALLDTELSLYHHFQILLDQEMASLSTESSKSLTDEDAYDCLASSAQLLHSVLKAKQQETHALPLQQRQSAHCYYPRRSATDSLLFRLIVALQLCLVRIDDARFVITGRRRRDRDSVVATTSQGTGWLSSNSLATAGLVGFVALAAFHLHGHPRTCYSHSRVMSSRPTLLTVAKMGFAALAAKSLTVSWSNLWMSTKIVKSTNEVEEWNKQWHLIQNTTFSSIPTTITMTTSSPAVELEEGECPDASLDAERSRRLIEYALHETPKVRPLFLDVMSHQ